MVKHADLPIYSLEFIQREMNTYMSSQKSPVQRASLAKLWVRHICWKTTQMNKQMVKQTGIFLQQNIANNCMYESSSTTVAYLKLPRPGPWLPGWSHQRQSSPLHTKYGHSNRLESRASRRARFLVSFKNQSSKKQIQPGGPSKHRWLQI